MRDRLRRRRRAARSRAPAPPTSRSTRARSPRGPRCRSPPGSTWRPPSPATRCRGPARWDRVLGRSVPVLGIVLLLGLGAGIVGGIAGARSREKPPRLPGALRPAGRDRARAGEVHLQRDRRPRDLRRHADVRRGEGGHRAHPRRRHLDDQGPQRPGGLGRTSTRSPSAARTSSAARAPRSRRTRRTSRPGKRLKDEIALFDNSVETWAQSSGNLVTVRARRLGRPARPRRLRGASSPSRSGTPSR